MRLSNRHANPQTLVLEDFSGGLNTTTNADGISENQLAMAVNVEADHNTRRLKTVAGTVDIFNSSAEIFAAMYDEINKKILVVHSDKTVYILNTETRTVGGSLGRLTGNLYPIYTSWEDGILIASGGNLQYYNGETLEIPTYPDGDSEILAPKADSVYIRAGRVIITKDSIVRYSAVGDEGNWTEDSGDASSSKFVEAGYKDGGSLLSLANLSQDILLVKDNRRVYRLSGEYPNWVINEVSRNVECSGRLSVCSVADAVFVLGKNEVQVIQTTESYGDVKPQNVASLVTKEIQKLQANAMVRYVPPLQQVWCIGENGDVMVFDTALNCWFKRQFNSAVVDVISIGDEVFVVKKNRIAKLDEYTFKDDGVTLHWNFQAKRLMSSHDYLLKRLQVELVPMNLYISSGEISAGRVKCILPVPTADMEVTDTMTYEEITEIFLKSKAKFLFLPAEKIFEDTTQIYGDEEKIFEWVTMVKENRNIYRNRFIDIRGHGKDGGFFLYRIILDIAEV